MKYYPIEIKCECGEKKEFVVYQNGRIVYECESCGESVKVPVEQES